MFFDVYHDGRFLGRFMFYAATSAIKEAANRFRIPIWELEAVEVEG